MDHRDESDGTIELSVVIPARNAADTIGEQLEALAHEIWDGAWEVIVVDNGSMDGTLAVVDSHRPGFANLRAIEAQDRAGAGYSRNQGVAAAKGRNIAFCDADDVVAPGWVAAMGSALRSQGFVAGALRFDGLNPPWLRTAFYTQPPTRLESFEGIFPIAATCNLGVARHVFESVGGFDDSYAPAEDLELCLRIWVSGTQLVFIPDAVVQYRYRPSLPALWRRSRQYGATGPAIARRLGELGCERPPRFKGLKNVIWLIRRLPSLRTRRGRARWLVVAATKIGRIEGSIRNRVLYL